MEIRFPELSVLLLLSYAIYVFISESFYLYRTDYYARHLSSYNKHRRRLAYWCGMSVLISGLVVSLFHGSLVDPDSMLIAIALASVVITPVAARYIFSRSRRGI